MKRHLEVTFEPLGRKVHVLNGTTILQAAKDARIKIRSECDGQGICGKCKVITHNVEGLSDLTENEKEHLSSSDISSGYRLACQTTITQDIVVTVPPESRIWTLELQTTGLERPVPLNPSIRKFHIQLSEPTLSDPTPDSERLIEYLEDRFDLGKLEIEYELLQILPKILRKADWNITATVWDNQKITGVQGGDTTDEILGLAVDIGTSKLAIHLVDLTTGRTVGTGAIENPQVAYGDDIMSRIAFAMNNPRKLELLQRSVVEAINSLVKDILTKTGISSHNIFEATVVGNTVMHHLFLGIQPKYLAQSPFIPCLKRAVEVKAKELNVKMHPNNIIHVLPIVAGFVGADAIGDLLSTGIHEAEDISLLVDIGTNTEVMIGNTEDILCCSCASGPAFEGGHIKHGTKAVLGAITKVEIHPDSYEVAYNTIGNQKPLGLCGSAVVDIVAELRLCGLINHRGQFNSEIETQRMRATQAGMEFIIADRRETAIEREITVTQKDINEIQLAKAAIFAACSILTEDKGLTEKGIDRLFIAGAFGTSLDIENAKILGLIPDIPTEKVQLVGNTAVTGAKMALLSRDERETAETLSRETRYLELTAHPIFSNEFARAMFIPHKNLERFPSVEKILGRTM